MPKITKNVAHAALLITAKDDTAWAATQRFDFRIQLQRPQQAACIGRDIKNAKFVALFNSLRFSHVKMIEHFHHSKQCQT